MINFEYGNSKIKFIIFNDNSYAINHVPYQIFFLVARRRNILSIHSQIFVYTYGAHMGALLLHDNIIRAIQMCLRSFSLYSCRTLIANVRQ